MRLTVKCEVCKVNKYVFRKLSKIYNINGKVWKNSKTCPKCYLSSKKLFEKEIKKIENKLSDELTDLPIFHSNRSCRKCKGQLEKTRWWHCELCKPNIYRQSDAWDDFIFEHIEVKPSQLNLIAGGSI